MYLLIFVHGDARFQEFALIFVHRGALFKEWGGGKGGSDVSIRL